jgi:acyl-CoA synthetase (AMP-forming)/AMP-acid ligase II
VIETVAEVVATLRRHGDRTAITVVDGESVSFERLADDAYRLANGLLDGGLGPGDRFAFSFPNGIEMVVCYLACAVSGIVAAPISQRTTEAEFEAQVRDCGASMLAREGLAELMAGSARPPVHRPRGDDPYCVMYTGGTTGTMKAAVQTQRSWAACLDTVVEEWRLDPECRHLAVLPMSHVAWFTVAAQLHAGGWSLVLDRWSPERVLDLVERERITTLNMIPTMLADLVEAHRRHDLSSLRQLTSAGSPMPEELYHRAHAVFGPRIGNIYGMTETSGPVTFLHPHELTGSRVRSGGRPGRYVELAIVDERGRSLPQGEVGEIALSGPQVSVGYLNQPEETEAAFHDGRFLTGDVGYVDEDGFVFVVDRRKEMIITGGYNVYPKEIEEVLYQHPDVVEAAVIGLPDRRWIEGVHAFVVPRDGATLTEDDLRAHCRASLAAYKVPKAVHVRRKLPRTAVGKFDKRALRDHALAEGTP